MTGWTDEQRKKDEKLAIANVTALCVHNRRDLSQTLRMPIHIKLKFMSRTHCRFCCGSFCWCCSSFTSTKRYEKKYQNKAEKKIKLLQLHKQNNRIKWQSKMKVEKKHKRTECEANICGARTEEESERCKCVWVCVWSENEITTGKKPSNTIYAMSFVNLYQIYDDGDNGADKSQR